MNARPYARSFAEEPRPPGAGESSTRRRGQLAIAAAAVWSLVYGLLGVYWALGGARFPFGVGDPLGRDMGSFFVAATPSGGGAVIAVLGLGSALVGLAMLRRPGADGRVLRAALLAFAWLACAFLVLTVPDVRVLQNVAYSFLLHFGKLDWPVVNQFVCMAGGALWGAAALTYQRWTRPAGDRPAAWSTPGAAARWGRRVTYAAALFALPYGLVRTSWMLGIPLGVTEAWVTALHADFAAKGAGIVKYFFGSESIVGALLILGLTQRWGEVLPRWTPFLAGRRVPIPLAVVPASFVAALITLAGVKFYRFFVPDLLAGNVTSDNWGIAAPAVSWFPWGVALGAATLAYYLRRRGERAAGPAASAQRPAEGSSRVIPAR